jgi:hypothetical protein
LTKDKWSVDTAKVTIGGVKYSVFEAITITDVTYPPPPGDSAAVYALRNTINSIGGNGADPRCGVFQLLFRDKQATGAEPPQGTVLNIAKYRSLKSGDTKSVDPVPVTVGNVALAQQDVTAIKAFPNPYYGVNRAETDNVNRFITFNHLPTNAIVRIFNLAGTLVRRIEKHDATTQFMRWDLLNENGLPVASGIYIVYIEMPDLDAKKTLKVAIIQEQQFLRNF